ncbi:MAG: AAA family ATPase [Bacteroidales bacterium]|nr:AAA family ATPase [Bacteroidales bacterium]MCF8337185.1 AAA family ATPase [Bacteroidales bacterium]
MNGIQIKGYKSIKDISLELRPINVLIGSNGSGKSNLLTFFNFLSALYNQKAQEYVALRGGIERFLHNGIKITPELSFSVQVNNTQAYQAVLQPDYEGAFFMTNENVSYLEKTIFSDKRFKKESDFKSQSNIKLKALVLFFEHFRKYHFHDTSFQSPFMGMSNIENDIYFLYEKGGNLAAFLYSISKENKKVYSRIIKNIQSIAPFFSDFYFYPNSEGYIRLQWQDRFSSNVYGPKDMSDGTIRFIALTTLFMQPKLPRIIIIDEPELGLHPAAVAKLAGMVKTAVSKGTQVILATQSPDLVNHFEAGEVITVDNNGESVFRRLNPEDLLHWLENYSLGEIWQRNIIDEGHPK